MVKRNTLENLYNEVNTGLFELINLIEVKIDVSYILEELEEATHKVKKINRIGDPIVEEMRKQYEQMYKKYEDKLAEFLPQKEAEKLIEQITGWIRRLPGLF